MLSQDERNHAVRVDAQTEEKPVTEDFLGKTEPRDYTPEYQLLDRLRMPISSNTRRSMEPLPARN